jgi:thymidylate kinase
VLKPYKHRLPGKLVVVTGIDGSGKTTVLNNCVHRLMRSKSNIEVSNLIPATAWSEPLVKEFINDPILSMEQNNLSLLSTTLILMGHRLKRLNENVIKSLRNGDIIFLDRYIYTALAEALMFNVNKSHLRTLSAISKDFPEPNLVIHFSSTVENCLKRISERKYEKLNQNSKAYLLKLAESFVTVSSQYDNFITLENNTTLELAEQKFTDALICNHII